MAGINKVILIGNLGTDPEVRTLENGTKIARFSLATSEAWKDKATGEKMEATEWHKIVVWQKKAEYVEKYIKKGSKVYIEGKLKTDEYDDKDGIKRYSTNIIANVIQGLDKNPNASNHQPTAPIEEIAPPPEGDDIEELPF